MALANELLLLFVEYLSDMDAAGEKADHNSIPLSLVREKENSSFFQKGKIRVIT
jgi:hypothetical protein